MGNTKIGIKLDETGYSRIKLASQKLNRTPNWLIKQAIFHYLDVLEKDENCPVLSLPFAKVDIENETLHTQESHQPFIELSEDILPQSINRSAITVAWRRPETEVVPFLLKKVNYSEQLSKSIQTLAVKLIRKLRNNKQSNQASKTIIQDLLQEFSLSSEEGVALMCLSEALLRIPDKATRDLLIRDKISNGNWMSHLRQNQSLFVNAISWSLFFTNKLFSTHRNINKKNLFFALERILIKGSEPLIRKGVETAMHLIGGQFVIGECITEAISNTKNMEKKGFLYSYDILGEAALTEEDARTYLFSYENAIQEIGKISNGRGIYEGPGISIKLSALHPRYCRTQYKRIITELYPRLLKLALLAQKYDIGFNIDAEESDRLEISLDLLEKLCFEPELAGWNGIGFVIQAYQKRCLPVIDELIELSKRSQHRLMVRLVKGAYWDSEIKKTQIEGLEDYPVFTRKVYTDLSYLTCAQKLLSVPNYIYPQFATHNAHTLSAIYYFAGQNYYSGQYEFQCLHGMGEALYMQVVGKTADGKLNRPCRIYAPVGKHETLLAYLVRRLLENGANTSFLNQIANSSVPIEQLIADPVKEVKTLALREGRVGLPHPKIPLPRNLYGLQRQNSTGLDLSNEHCLASLSAALLRNSYKKYQATPIIDSETNNKLKNDQLIHFVRNPANSQDIVGEYRHTSLEEIEQALVSSVLHSERWAATLPAKRASLLKEAANLFEKEMKSLIGLLVREAGKNFSNAIAEVREAVDFLRYYAAQIEKDFDPDTYRPLGPVVCISPWNFPLAIFVGQVAAALAAGNTVLAKPAEQTPLIAARAVELILASGVPKGVLQLLLGRGKTIGFALVNDSRVRGVLFTGSTQVARLLYNTLSLRLDPNGRPIPLIAETGGLNAMLVDSSALTEQVVSDVLMSAFDSAGQRCSALRLLCIQNEVADRTLNMLRGAMIEYKQGNPEYLDTDIGPIIDASAKEAIEDYITAMRESGYNVWQTNIPSCMDQKGGTFIPLTLIELNSIDELKKEIFGPVLHVVRYCRSEIDNVIDKINASGYGLTLGLHTRIDGMINRVISKARVGNFYINRNIVGAVVGVQPFGGEGLSGTGPKAGGPLYLYRLLTKYHYNDNTLSTLLSLDSVESLDFLRSASSKVAHFDLVNWMEVHHSSLVSTCRFLGKISQAGSTRLLVGPTGEKNSYLLLPRERILCLADKASDLLLQLAAITSIGARVLWNSSSQCCRLFSMLPESVQRHITLIGDWKKENIVMDAVLFHGDSKQLRDLIRTLAVRPGPLITVESYASGDSQLALERFLIERVVSINTTASGGNATLMTIG